MSATSIRSSTSQTSSHSSSTTMTSIATHQPSHPYLTSGRASTISTWQSSVSARRSQPKYAPEADVGSQKAAIEAYQQLKLALFSRAGTPRPS
ncbi:hypothetical protein GQ44DRAFT_698371 [Phaeosphaeriaceae sp. PMI808]|nr:hypothetical protein GQ44DRAFT_698371 [Phaeosphaeriaceae sp. PMI808]